MNEAAKPILPVSIRQAARWAVRNDCLYIGGDFTNPMYAVWSSNTHDAVCIGAYEKCRDWIKAKCKTEHSPCSGCYYAASYRGKDDSFRMDSLDEVLEGMEQSDAEARVPEHDYRHESWAH